MKLHKKGYLLVELNKTAGAGMWDDEIVDKTLQEYGQSGSYWRAAIQLALEELAAAGLVTRLQSKLKQHDGKPVLTFSYAVSDFGRSRMKDTGLLLEDAT